MTQAITVKEVKANAAKAYDDGLLLAQASPRTMYGYSQECDDGITRFCAIGASLDESVRHRIKINGLDSVSLGTLGSGLVGLRTHISWKSRQAKKLTAIQFSHDHWMKMVKRSNPETGITVALLEAETHFLKTIGHKRAT